jgi:hypothetical protein
MSSQFRPLEIPPGVVAMPTKQMRSSNWSEVNLMRWVEGMMSPIGGQAQYTYSFASRCKMIHDWYGLGGTFRIAYLCESNLYVDVGGTLYDITPGGGMIAPQPLTTGGYGDGNYSDSTYGTPRTISTIQALDKVPDAWSLDNFGAILLAMTSPDGRLLQWNPANGAPGVGGNPHATAAWTTSSTTIPIPAGLAWIAPGMNVYDLTNNQQIGTVASYATTVLTLTAAALHASSGAADQLEIGNIATPVVANSGRGVVPTGRLFVVTQERFVQIHGAYDSVNGGGQRRFAWCDQENFQAWDYSSVTSQAGFLDIEPASPIITAKATSQGVLFWTATTAYLSAFLGIPYVYNYTEIGKSCTPWSPCSVASTVSMTLWMSQQGLYSYNGAWIQPVPLKIRPWIDDDIDILNVREQACAVHVAPFNEFWWFFPQGPANNPSGYNSRVAIYNYKEGWCSMGRMSRSAGVSASYTIQTIMADGLNAFQHETGVVYPANVPLPWAETFDLNLASGSKLTTVKQMIPDVKGDVNNLLYQLMYKLSRSVMPDQNGNPIPVTSLHTTPVPVNTSNGFVDFRVTGRDVRLRIALVGPQVNPVTVGQHLIDSVQRGDR